jgi:hypothetical protein
MWGLLEEEEGDFLKWELQAEGRAGAKVLRLACSRNSKEPSEAGGGNQCWVGDKVSEGISALAWGTLGTIREFWVEVHSALLCALWRQVWLLWEQKWRPGRRQSHNLDKRWFGPQGQQEKCQLHAEFWISHESKKWLDSPGWSVLDKRKISVVPRVLVWPAGRAKLPTTEEGEA